METTRKLQIEQLDKKFKKLSGCVLYDPPPKGWINLIRVTLNMSLKQLGKRLNITQQSTKEIENREQSKSITLKGLNEAANALDMKLVYFLIPKDESLEKLIERKALEKASEIVGRTSHTMLLENQATSTERLNNAVKQKETELKEQLPKYLWD